MVKFITKRLTSLRIKSLLFSSISIIMITTLVIVILVSLHVFSYLNLKNQLYVKQMIDTTKKNIFLNYANIRELMLSIAYNSTIQEFLSSQKEIEKYELSKKVENTLSYIKDIHWGIKDIILRSISGNTFGYQYQIDINQSLFEEISNQKLPYCLGFWRIDSRIYLLFGMAIYKYDSFTHHKIGDLIFIVEPTYFGIIDGTTNSKKMISFYLQDLKNITFPPLQNHYLSHKQRNSPRLQTITSSLPYLNLKLLSVINNTYFLQEEKKTKRLVLLSLAIIIIVTFVAVSITTKVIVSPLNKLSEHMHNIGKIKDFNFNEQISITGFYELNILVEEFNRMISKILQLTMEIRNTTAKLYETELLKKQAEILFLKSQIRPHLILNSLEHIKILAVNNGIQSIVNIIKLLGSILKYALNNVEWVRISQEIDMVKKYIILHSAIYNKNIKFEENIDERASGCYIPKITIQPFIENSLYHGFSVKNDNCLITINCKFLQNNMIEIIIKDNGIGMNKEKLNFLYKQINNTSLLSSENNHGIGFANVIKRLTYYFGNNFSFMIESQPNNGTTITLIFPANQTPLPI